MPAQQKQRGKNRKYGRNLKHQAAIYRAEDRARKNRRRRIRRHLRNHPLDEGAAKLFAAEFGETALATSVGVSGRAQRREARKNRFRRRVPAPIAAAL
jgi:hypothetical protein